MHAHFGLGNIYLDHSVNESNERAKTKEKLQHIFLKRIRMLIYSYLIIKTFAKWYQRPRLFLWNFFY